VWAGSRMQRHTCPGHRSGARRKETAEVPGSGGMPEMRGVMQLLAIGAEGLADHAAEDPVGLGRRLSPRQRRLH